MFFPPSVNLTAQMYSCLNALQSSFVSLFWVNLIWKVKQLYELKVKQSQMMEFSLKWNDYRDRNLFLQILTYTPSLPESYCTVETCCPDAVRIKTITFFFFLPDTEEDKVQLQWQMASNSIFESLASYESVFRKGEWDILCQYHLAACFVTFYTNADQNSKLWWLLHIVMDRMFEEPQLRPPSDLALDSETFIYPIMDIQFAVIVRYHRPHSPTCQCSRAEY